MDFSLNELVEQGYSQLTKEIGPFVAFIYTFQRGEKGRIRDHMSLMNHSVNFAIEAQMKVGKDDFKTLEKLCNIDSWLWSEIGLEEFYTTAAESNNISASKSIENYLGRKPFILHYQDNEIDRSKRLHVGSAFIWKGRHGDEKVKCTNFILKGENWCMIACSYKEKTGEGSSEAGRPKIEHRYSITQKEFLAARKAGEVRF
jgi:hypothetical protein